MARRRFWLPSVDFMVFIAVGVLCAAIAIPGLLSSQRASNERQASTMLKTFTSAEAEFRANDRDHNKVPDFWTGDVSGLYLVKPADGGPELRLIELDAADADAKPLFPLSPKSGPRQGYRYQALDQDDSVAGGKGIYRVDTDHSGRKVHNLGAFGFTAFPSGSGFGAGKYHFMVNENGTVFRWRFAQARTNWPSDEELTQLSCRDD